MYGWTEGWNKVEQGYSIFFFTCSSKNENNDNSKRNPSAHISDTGVSGALNWRPLVPAVLQDLPHNLIHAAPGFVIRHFYTLLRRGCRKWSDKDRTVPVSSCRSMSPPFFFYPCVPLPPLTARLVAQHYCSYQSILISFLLPSSVFACLCSLGVSSASLLMDKRKTSICLMKQIEQWHHH